MHDHIFEPRGVKIYIVLQYIAINTINIFLYLEQKYSIFIEIRQILSELHNILCKKNLQNGNKISFNEHFKRTRSEILLRENFAKIHPY